MSEKGDLGLPSDPAISLPPNYAPSETFTDSPPPAYQRKNAPIIRIARMVCITVLAVTFLVGFFIVAHRYVVAKHQVLIMEELRPKTEFLTGREEESIDLNQLMDVPLIKGASFISLPIDNNKIEDDIQLKGDAIDQLYPIEPESSTENKEDEDFPPEQVPPPSPFPGKGLLFPFQDQITKVRLAMGGPKFPGMIKPNGNCKVQKRSKNIAPGIKEERIIVVCDNEGKFNDAMDSMGAPPMTFIPPQSRPFRPPFPFMGPQPRPMDQPMHFMGLQSGPMETPMHFMGPQSGPMEPQMHFMGPQSSPMEPPMSLLSTILKVLSSKKFEKNSVEEGGPRVINLINMDDNMPILPPLPIRGDPQEIPPPISGPPKGLFPLMNLFPMANIKIRAQIPFKEEGQDNDAEILPPFLQRLPFNGPFPFPQNAENIGEPQIPNMKPNIKIIRINRPPFGGAENNMDNEGPFPFPLKSIMKFLPAGRQARVIRIRPRIVENDDQIRPQFPFPSFMFQNPEEHHEGLFPHPMPEASGRALPDPVAIPGSMKMIRLPFTPPRRFPMDPRITHMEMKQQPFNNPQDRQRSFTLSPFQKIYIPSPNDLPEETEHKHDDRQFPFTPNHINDFFHHHNDDQEHFHDEGNDFGPPRTHTLMHQSPHPIFMGEDNHHHEHPHHPPRTTGPDFDFHTHADGISHSHPHYGPHTHIGDRIIPVNPQENDEPNYHTHEDGVSHSHPFVGPHTHLRGRIFPIIPEFRQIEGPNFHVHRDGLSHSHPFEGPHTHMGEDIIPIIPEPSQNENSDFHTHQNGMSHSHHFEGPHTHMGEDIIPIIPEPSQNENSNFHTHQDGVSHSHPFDGPHTHLDGEILPFMPLPEQNNNFHVHENGVSHSHPFEGVHNHDEEIQQEQNTNFQVPENQENFFISEPEYEEFPLVEPAVEETREPLFEFSPDMFEHQSVFDQPPNPFQPILLEESVFQPEPMVQPEESMEQPEEPMVQPEELTIQPEEPTFLPEEPTFLPEEPTFLPEEPTFLIEEPLFRPVIPEEIQSEPEQVEFVQLDERGYAPEGIISPNPPPIEDDAEFMEPLLIVEEPVVDIK